MTLPELRTNVPGYQIEEISEYDPVEADVLWELVLFESPWKRERQYSPEEIEKTIRQSIEPDNTTVIAARQTELGIVRSTMQIVAKTFMDAGTVAELGYVSTHPDFRGRGLFTALWGHGLHWLLEREIRTMTWNSNPAIEHREQARRMYERFGAVVFSVSPDPTNLDAGTDCFKLDVAHGVEVYREIIAEH